MALLKTVRNAMVRTPSMLSRKENDRYVGISNACVKFMTDACVGTMDHQAVGSAPVLRRHDCYSNRIGGGFAHLRQKRR
jgi:hypothetical protein